MMQLQAAGRLAALGNMAAGLGHDIANMVLPIRSRLELLQPMCHTEEAPAPP
jgi:C4-dicarboxylate-specific signal transduction histidine kinase